MHSCGGILLDMNQMLQFTHTDVKKTLYAMAAGRTLPSVLCNLHALEEPDLDLDVQRKRLRVFLYDVVIREYNRQRQTVHLPPMRADELLTREQMLAYLKEDFRQAQVILEAWSALYARFFAPYPLSVAEMAAGVGYNERQFRRRVSRGIELLTQVLQEGELAWQRHARRNALHKYLPARESGRLFGVDEHVEKLKEILSDSSHAPIVSVEGLGGIGKTALARVVVDLLADELPLAGIAWVSARTHWLDIQGDLHTQSTAAHATYDVLTRLATQLEIDDVAGLGMEALLGRLRPHLRTHPFLVVVDNLETVDDVRLLVPALASCAGATRFLLTTRHSAAKFSSVYRFSVPELAFKAAWELFAHELQQRGGRILHDGRMSFAQVFELVGGLPLALKLTAAQLAYLPLDDVLNNLKQGEAASQANLYTYIYRHTWTLLDDEARRLLLAMLWVSPDGEDADWLRVISRLSSDEFYKALQQLQAFSLLEVTGTLSTPLYHLHRLTNTFLRTQILQQWEYADDDGHIPAP